LTELRHPYEDKHWYQGESYSYGYAGKSSNTYKSWHGTPLPRQARIPTSAREKSNNQPLIPKLSRKPIKPFGEGISGIQQTPKSCSLSQIFFEMILIDIVMVDLMMTCVFEN